ncbi:MAG: hypothetical protein A2X36_03315 [Elusimicrobia bacterium GWA2_69_24]|nr:MAG: hypothetical protein A2X36_03315 [Elusimicrobia bacterium GWA2_69_24]
MRLDLFLSGTSRGNPGPAAIGVTVQDGSGAVVKEYCRPLGEATGNVAEYTAVIDALSLAAELGGTELKVHSDSQFLIRELQGDVRIKNDRLQKYRMRVGNWVRKFASVEFVRVTREQNARAGALALQGLNEQRTTPVFVRGSRGDAEPEVARRFEVSREQQKRD